MFLVGITTPWTCRFCQLVGAQLLHSWSPRLVCSCFKVDDRSLDGWPSELCMCLLDSPSTMKIFDRYACKPKKTHFVVHAPLFGYVSSSRFNRCRSFGSGAEVGSINRNTSASPAGTCNAVRVALPQDNWLSKLLASVSPDHISNKSVCFINVQWFQD